METDKFQINFSLLSLSKLVCLQDELIIIIFRIFSFSIS